MTHIIVEACDPFHVGTLLSHIPKPLVFGKCFNPIYKSKLFDVWLAYTHFYKGHEERHNDTEGIWGELEGSHIKVLKHRFDKIVNG